MITTLFIALATITVLSVFGLYVFICLYVYNDAKINSDKPVLWLLITIFTPNLFGFLIYMLAGRNKDRKPVKKFKIPSIVSAVILVISTAALTTCVLFSNNLPVISSVSIGMINNNIGSQWEVSFRTSGETLERTIAVTDEELENLTVEASCEEGELYLLMVQGKNAEVIDITDFPEAILNPEGFTAGNIRLSLYNEGAKDARVRIEW